MAVHQAAADGQTCERCQARIIAEGSEARWPTGASIYVFDGGRASQMVESKPTCQPARTMRLNEDASRPMHDAIESGENDVSANLLRRSTRLSE